MGQQASAPRPGAQFKVIGAGLPRTGTASFSAALSILLDGPVYHGGTQITLGAEVHVKSWISIFSRTPIRSDSDRQFILESIRDRMDGYVATVDAPGAQFVPELMELYPDAIVICTVRDPDEWAKSIDAVAASTLQWYLRVVLFPLPSLRHFPHYLGVLQAGRWGELYARPGDPNLHGRLVWDRHMEWLERVVPKEKLVFVNVKDGWEGICKALGCEVPKDVAFPRINDSKAIDATAKKHIMRGLIRWAGIIAVIVAVASIGMRLFSDRESFIRWL
jgi:hypothetical protein